MYGVEKVQGSEPRVLIIDDEEDFCLSLADVLTSRGYATRCVHSYDQAAAAVEDFVPGVCMVDVRLGSESGIALLAELKANQPELKFLVMTAYADTSVAIDAIKHGVYDFLPKPLDLKATLAALERCFAQIDLEMEKARVESALAASEEQYRLLAENVSDVIWVMDRELSPQYYSPSISRLRGVTPEQAMRQPLEDILTPDSYRLVRDTMLRELRREGSGHADPDRLILLELELYHVDGRTIWTEVSIHIMRDDKGDPTGIIGVTRDISKRKLAERALKESEAKYRVLVNNIPDVMWITDRSGQTTFVSSNVEEVLGFSPDEIYSGGRDLILSRVHPDDREHTLASLEALFESGTAYDVEYRIRRRDDRVIWCRDRAVMSYETGGNRIAYGLFSDITRRKEADREILSHREKLQRLAAQLSMAEQRERRRVATELHDRVVQGMALAKLKLGQFMEEVGATGSAAGVQALDSLDEAIREARSLTFDLSPPSLQVLGLVAAVGELVDRFRDAHGVECSFTAGDLGGDIDDDSRNLAYQAARELLNNTAKHAGASWVAVSLHRRNSFLTLRVEDDGAGFANRRLGPRADTLSGFGLFSLRERLAALNGSLHIESKPGSGARVTVDIPVHMPQVEGS